MIQVKPQPKPAGFDALVAVPGTAFLLLTPHPSSKQFESHAYWRRILPELRASYKSVCAYSSFYVPECTGADTVEHFLPKVPHPQDAYKWENYRFVCQRLNQRKGRKDDVLDPFEVENGWFRIEFPSLMVKPRDGLPHDIHTSVVNSINRIGLNDESTVWKQRERFTSDYCLGLVTFEYLMRDAPFLAAEIERQGLVDRLSEIMGYQ